MSDEMTPARLDQTIADLAAWGEAHAHELSLEERTEKARIWVWEIGRPKRQKDGTLVDDLRPDLVVRCAGPNKKGVCGERMARVWWTPYGHMAEWRLAVSHDGNMAWLTLAMDAREAGDGHGEAIASSGVDRPVIPTLLLEALVEEGLGVIRVGCKRRHGNMAVAVSVLIAEADGPNRVLPIRPAAQWDH